MNIKIALSAVFASTVWGCSSPTEETANVGEDVVKVTPPVRDFPSDVNIDTGGAVLSLLTFPADANGQASCFVGPVDAPEKNIELEFSNNGVTPTSENFNAKVSFCSRTENPADCEPGSADVVGTTDIEVPIIPAGETVRIAVNFDYKEGELNPDNRINKCARRSQENAICRISVQWYNQLQHRYCRVVYG